MGALLFVCLPQLLLKRTPPHCPARSKAATTCRTAGASRRSENRFRQEDLILNIQPSPDGKVMIAEHGGYNPHGLVIINVATDEVVQHIPLVSSWFGLAWQPDGTKLYVSGGNTKKGDDRAPVYEFEYKDGRLSEKPLRNLMETIEPKEIYWAGLRIIRKRTSSTRRVVPRITLSCSIPRMARS